MATARSSRETFYYVLKCDRGLEPGKQTTFHLRRLPTRIMMALQNLQTIDVNDMRATVRVGDQKHVKLRAGLAGWDNYLQADGTPVEFKADAGQRSVLGVVVDNPASEGSIAFLQAAHAEELVEAIDEGNTLTADDVGN